MRSRILMILLALAVLAPRPAEAHKVVAAVYASGDVITGQIGMPNGDMAANTLVEAFDDGGNKIGQTRTNAEGVFTFKPARQVTHIFRANLGSGHVAKMRIDADELPKDISKAKPELAPTITLTKAQQQKIIEEIRRQITPLRKEIAAYKEKNDLQSILGGIGYIFGLFGIGFYIAARRRDKA